MQVNIGWRVAEVTFHAFTQLDQDWGYNRNTGMRKVIGHEILTMLIALLVLIWSPMQKTKGSVVLPVGTSKPLLKGLEAITYTST